MMGERLVDQGLVFSDFSMERDVPADHLLRSIDRFIDLGKSAGGRVAQGDIASGEEGCL